MSIKTPFSTIISPLSIALPHRLFRLWQIKSARPLKPGAPTRHILRFTYGTSGKECWGGWNSSTRTGWGPAYENSCIHSGAISSSGDLPTNWYNYTLATAGTIIDKDTTSTNPATNTNKATESICPRGWTLPDKTQTRSIAPDGGSATYISSFSPVLGGNYRNSALEDETVRGFWWGSEFYDGARRYRLNYNGSSSLLGNNNGGRRYDGYYIRCVQAP